MAFALTGNNHTHKHINRPSENLGTPQSNGMGAGMTGRDAAAEAAEDEDKTADARGLTPTEFEEEAVNDEAVTDLHQGTDARLCSSLSGD